jgi:Short coiled-coil protein
MYLALLDKIETVQLDCEKLVSEKKFLEDYIGNLMVISSSSQIKAHSIKQMQQGTIKVTR